MLDTYSKTFVFFETHAVVYGQMESEQNVPSGREYHQRPRMILVAKKTEEVEVAVMAVPVAETVVVVKKVAVVVVVVAVEVGPAVAMVVALVRKTGYLIGVYYQQAVRGKNVRNVVVVVEVAHNGLAFVACKLFVERFLRMWL